MYVAASRISARNLFRRGFIAGTQIATNFNESPDTADIIHGTIRQAVTHVRARVS